MKRLEDYAAGKVKSNHGSLDNAVARIKEDEEALKDEETIIKLASNKELLAAQEAANHDLITEKVVHNEKTEAAPAEAWDPKIKSEIASTLSDQKLRIMRIVQDQERAAISAAEQEKKSAMRIAAQDEKKIISTPTTAATTALKQREQYDFLNWLQTRAAYDAQVQKIIGHEEDVQKKLMSSHDDMM